MFLAVCFALTMLLCTSLIAADRNLPDGHVIYRQNFSDTKGVILTGMYFGTLSSPDATAVNRNGKLLVDGQSDLRTYLLLPAESPGNTYTFSATISLTEAVTANGYCAILISAWGDAPRNRAEIIIRADGTVDDFSEPTETVRRLIAEGGVFTLTVPVKSGAIDEIIIDTGDEKDTLIRREIKIVTGGGVGFSLRGMAIEIDEVILISGVDFDSLSGVFADKSYSNSQDPDDGIRASEKETEETSSREELPPNPPTGDFCTVLALIIAASAISAFICVLAKKAKL